MVGYTALGQINETLSLALVNEQRRLIRPILNKHNGREVKTIGDAFLVEFSSALSAVRCAYDVQRVTREFNMSLPEERKLHLRIGVHLGDVVESRGDISGDAVNVASRIEHLAEDGGVCLTRQVYDQVQNKFELPLKSLGPRSLKNVNAPVEVYKMGMPWDEETTPEPTKFERRRIAVLPFVNMSPEPEDEYFADGITEELIDRLAQLSELRVIARTSIMSYKKKEKKISEIAKELAVGSLIEGSVRKAGNRIRITVQLIDGGTEEHLWSSRYDKDFGDVFAIQTDIAQRVTEQAKLHLLDSERRMLGKRPTGNTEAYRLYLKGRYYWNERTRESMNKASRYFDEVVKLDPRFALAYSGLADCNIVSPSYGWQMPREAFPLAKEYALRAIGIDPGLAEPHASLAMVYADYEYKWNDAEEEFKRAVELKASYATAYHWHSIILAFIGRFGESYEEASRARALDPLSPIINVNLGVALLGLGKAKEAIEQFERVKEDEPGYVSVHNYLGWAYYLDSRTNNAIEEMRRSVVLSGNDPQYKAELACMLGFSGKRDEANEIIGNLESLSKITYVSKVRMAFALFGAGRTDEAFSYLEKAYEERSSNILYFRVWPWFREARQNAKWTSLERRFDLPKN
jgi:adenylate cyclase